eukprot:3905099-Amphidinium_carterae.2
MAPALAIEGDFVFLRTCSIAQFLNCSGCYGRCAPKVNTDTDKWSGGEEVGELPAFRISKVLRPAD